MGDLQIVPAAAAGKNVEAQYVEMMVPLYSYGCGKKVKRTLSHLKGIYSVTVDYHQQKVTVWGICNKYDVLATVRSKRKEARFWNPEDNVALLEVEEQTRPPNSPNSDTPPPSSKDYHYSFSSSKPSLALTKVRSLSLKAWKRLVFTRSYSF